MKNQIKNIIKKFQVENDIDFRFSFDMPEGYETAFGSFDVVKNTLFLNLNIEDKTRIFYTLFHELRHALQYHKPFKFDKMISQSLDYVVLYNGICFKLIDNVWRKCKLEGFDFLNIYLSLPYEIDANEYAYAMTENSLGASLTLQEIYKQNKPKVLIDYKTIKKVFNEIDKKC